NRHSELASLNKLLTSQARRPSQLFLMYGRRRVGKTVLLRHWVRESNVTYTYWSAQRETGALQRRKFYAELLGIASDRAPVFASWGELWDSTADVLRDKKHIIVLAELPYAAESDPAMLSALQHAWDKHFQESQVIFVLCGSHVRVMETLMTRQSPLFGRMTGQWHLEPLVFTHLQAFFPNWSAEERVAAYSIVGGIPAYYGSFVLE
ncbi:MAG: ATP-binding protein, partial [Chloroflexota bacterium]